jgi:hypothetical protein
MCSVHSVVVLTSAPYGRSHRHPLADSCLLRAGSPGSTSVARPLARRSSCRTAAAISTLVPRLPDAVLEFAINEVGQLLNASPV